MTYAHRISVVLFTLGSLSLGQLVSQKKAIAYEAVQLLPIEETPIRLLDETTVMTLGLDKRWAIERTSRLRNPTSKSVELRFGFPEKFIEGMTGSFKGLETTARGVALKRGQVKNPTARISWAPAPYEGRVQVYRIEIKARETVEVVLRYKIEGKHLPGPTIVMVSRTKGGAAWSGTIRRARFVVRAHEHPLAVLSLSEFSLLSYAEKIVKRRAVTELVFEVKEYVPQNDFYIELNYGAGSLNINSDDCPPRIFDKCPNMGVLAMEMTGLDDARQRAIVRGPITGEEVWTLPSREKLGELSLNELGICRNLPFAIHGRPFQFDKLRKIFYDDNKCQSEGRIARWFTRNPHYSDALIRPIDVAYMKAFDREIERRSKKKSR